jgi:hypothetical protein
MTNDPDAHKHIEKNVMHALDLMQHFAPGANTHMDSNNTFPIPVFTSSCFSSDRNEEVLILHPTHLCLPPSMSCPLDWAQSAPQRGGCVLWLSSVCFFPPVTELADRFLLILVRRILIKCLLRSLTVYFVRVSLPTKKRIQGQWKSHLHSLFFTPVARTLLH